MDITDTAMDMDGDTATDTGITVERLVHRIPISRKHTVDAIIVITDRRIALDLKGIMDTTNMDIITKDAIVISGPQLSVPVRGMEEWHTMVVRCHHQGTLVLHHLDRGVDVDIHSADPAAWRCPESGRMFAGDLDARKLSVPAARGANTVGVAAAAAAPVAAAAAARAPVHPIPQHPASRARTLPMKRKWKSVESAATRCARTEWSVSGTENGMVENTGSIMAIMVDGTIVIIATKREADDASRNRRSRAMKKRRNNRNTNQPEPILRPNQSWSIRIFLGLDRSEDGKGESILSLNIQLWMYS